MTQEHPITPPPELVKQWEGSAYSAAPIPYTHHIARCAARWGADQELEACCAVVDAATVVPLEAGQWLRAARRPKPPSLKELNLKHLEVMERDGHYLPEIIADLRRAIESLPS